MRDFPFDIVGFDLDGTLLDTSGDLLAATNHALALAGRPLLSRDRIKSMIGGGAKNMLKQGLAESGGYDEAVMARVYPELLAFYGENLSNHSRPFDGVIDTLDELDRRGVKAAIVTNKFERFALRLLGELGLDHRFAAIIGGDTLGKGNAKPSAAPIHEMLRAAVAAARHSSAIPSTISSPPGTPACRTSPSASASCFSRSRSWAPMR